MSPEPATLGSDPTDRELQALRAFAETGDYQRAADALGVSRSAVQARLARIRARLGVDSTAVAIWRLRDRLAA